MELVGDQFSETYMKKLKDFLLSEKKSGKQIFPPGREIFTAFNLVSLESVKAVIIGQDPYHGPGQAHGLSFSVKQGQQIPPSLQNIFKEIEADLGLANLLHSGRGDLSGWADQGVLLMNSVLTVEANLAASHRNRGWEQFTDVVLQRLSNVKKGLVFLLWGSYAQSKESLIDCKKHHVLSAPHPSPLSAHRGFFGCKHFSRTNQYLSEMGYSTIDWSDLR